MPDLELPVCASGGPDISAVLLIIPRAPADYSFLFGDAGDKPVVGDWDGDAVDEIGLRRESTGFFYYRNTLTTGNADGQFYFGDPDDRFVAGDWGVVDGADTPGLFRPLNQVFYFRHNLTPMTRSRGRVQVWIGSR